MTAIQASIIMPQTIASPTLATPRPSSLSLRPGPSQALGNGEMADGLTPNIGDSAPSMDGEKASDSCEDEEQDHEVSASSSVIDGRITPTASSTSSNLPSPNPTTISLLSQTTQSTNPAPVFSACISHPAEIGLGNLQAEEQLKAALQSKDRMFLLVLAKEFEAFISRLPSSSSSSSSLSESTSSTPPPTLNLASQIASSSTMPVLGASVNIGVTPTSKFQRMLVYKTAEWYGLKALSGQDGQMIVGVLGLFDDKSNQLRLSELVPAAPSPTQKFRIMQRTAPQNGSRSSSADGMNGGTRVPKWKSLEEREVAYAAAREKIYGKAPDVDGNGSQVDGKVHDAELRAGASVDDDIDPVPRQLYTHGMTGGSSGTVAQSEVIFPSLYHPPKAEPPAPPPIPALPVIQSNQFQSQVTPPRYDYQSGYNPYPQQSDMSGYSAMPTYTTQQSQQQLHYGALPQGYMNGGQGYMVPQQNGYTPQVWQQSSQPIGGPYAGQVLPPNPPPQQYMSGPNQQNGPGQGWQYPHSQMVNNNPQIMPMIPQGMPYPNSYGYAQQAPPPPPPSIPQQRQGMYPLLVQPTPMRPQIQPHSSASSSISSRSYQDGSRPHSRGSTTSTRSAASSVRLGAMYPAAQGPGYRQKAMKGPGFNGMTSLGMGTDSNKVRTRGHSPSSTTTTSSRSSRHTNSIQLASPSDGQHQLPMRPDWAANNVPYHPSPMPLPGSNHHSSSGPNAAEFPPLLRQGQGTNAEPMQVERAKMKPLKGTVWNGAAVKTIQHAGASTGYASGNGGGGPSPASPRMTIIPGPSRTPGPGGSGHGHGPTFGPQSSQPVSQMLETDPDFPRRLPANTAPTLYDPSAPRMNNQQTPSAVPSANPNMNSNSMSSAGSRPSSIVNPVKMNPIHLPGPTASGTLSADEIIEAKLAAVSINAGVSIGPPPARNGGASYAKIVRRD